jgi:predicted nucleic acid-binding protein
MAWLLDTNVLSELRRPKPEQRVVAFVAGRPLEQLYISAVTLAEIRFGIELVGEPNRRAELNEWLAHKVRPMFDQRVLQITEDIMSSPAIEAIMTKRVCQSSILGTRRSTLRCPRVSEP